MCTVYSLSPISLLRTTYDIMSSGRGFGCDDETGEVVFYQVDEETGEPTVDLQPPCITSRNTSVPEPKLKKYTKFPKGRVTKSKKFQTLKENIIAGSNPVSHRMLLIPTVLMIFPGFICICLTLLEVFLHFRCHRKNKHLKNPHLYYRSPFHAVTSIFCGFCRESETAVRVGQMQDKRRYRYHYLGGIAL